MTVRYYDKSGMEIGYEDYVYLRYDGVGNEDDYKRVAETEIETENVWISTVWLGMDYGFDEYGGTGDPLIFETMVFAILGNDVVDMSGLWVDKSASLAEAQGSHDHAVAMAYAGFFRVAVEESCRRLEEESADEE